MNTDDLAKRIIAHVQKTDVTLLTDSELLAIVNAPATDHERATVRRYSGGRTDDIRELTDNELERLLNGWPVG